MAVSVVSFSLTSAAYQDVSGGYTACSFRVPFVSQKNNAVWISLGTSLPAAATDNHDEFMAPATPTDEWQLHFHELTTGDRVYVRAARDPVTLKVYRK